VKKFAPVPQLALPRGGLGACLRPRPYSPGCAPGMQVVVCEGGPPWSSASSSQNGPLRLAPETRRGRSFPGSRARWRSSGERWSAIPVTSSFLLSFVATFPPWLTRRHLPPDNHNTASNERIEAIWPRGGGGE
jgi:hypothetical protein